jgi:hypothetical protein
MARLSWPGRDKIISMSSKFFPLFGRAVTLEIEKKRFNPKNDLFY